MITLLLGGTICLLIGCSQKPSQEHYYVLVVEGEENVIKKFAKYASVKDPIIKIDYYKSIKDANKQYPGYKIESPVVYIFLVNKNREEIILKTTNIEKSLRKLQSILEI